VNYGNRRFSASYCQEQELIVWLLEHGRSYATNFLPQLDVMSARNSCGCGCPSIEFSVPLVVPYIETPQGMRANFTGTADGVRIRTDVGCRIRSSVRAGGIYIWRERGPLWFS
jgi:hypothetical protein